MRTAEKKTKMWNKTSLTFTGNFFAYKQHKSYKAGIKFSLGYSILICNSVTFVCVLFRSRLLTGEA